MRKPGLINASLLLALALAPAIGALLHWALASAAHGRQIDFHATVIANARIGYLLALPVLLPVALLLRQLRLDSVLISALAGFAIGVAAYFTVLTTAGNGWAPLIFQGGLLFALMMLALRLVAGRRA